MHATALAVEEEWRERLGPERLAAFRDTLLALLPGGRQSPRSRDQCGQRLVPSAGMPGGAWAAGPVPAAAGTSSPRV